MDKNEDNKELFLIDGALVPFPEMDAAAVKGAGQHWLRWGFQPEAQTKSDKRNISPGV